MQLCNSSHVFSGLPVRDLLDRVGFQAKTIDDQITLGLIYETDDETRAARQRSHLTNATAQNFQIRFPLRERVSRGLIKLAASVNAARPQGRSIEVGLLRDDFVSVDFFSKLELARIHYLDGDESSADHGLSEAELEIARALERPEAHLSRLLAKSNERLYAGDYRTASRLLSGIPEAYRNDSVHYILGLCANFFSRTEESELHFRKMLSSESALARVQAAYVTSMLYLRMHRRDRQCLATAESLLQDAFATLERVTGIPDLTFHRVFNRNGYALCLFRRGRVQQALGLLETGIGELQASADEGHRLHQSVLIYNSIQCLRSLRRFDECETKCDELLAIDPRFPEYFLEKAHVLIDQKRYQDALDVLDRARELDPFMGVTRALKGYCSLELGQLELACAEFARAHELEPTHPSYLLDLAYCEAELSKERA